MRLSGWAALALPLLHVSVASAQQYVISTHPGGAPQATPVLGTAASIGLPVGIATDAAGNVYFASDNCVFKLDTNGVLTLMAGNSRVGYSGDGGPAAGAQLNLSLGSSGVALDGAGNMYVADTYNNRIRQVTAAGIVSTVAGGGSQVLGDGGPATSAQLNDPVGVAVDSAGNLYIADTGNDRIRKVTPAGTISTIAGNGTVGYSGDGGPALNAQLNRPNGVAVDSAGNVYIADSTPGTGGSPFVGNNAIRLLQPKGPGPGPPLLTPGGIAPDFSSVTTIQPGEWVSIYGTNFANTATAWNGTFTTTLGGASVVIDGRAAWMEYVSPLQINVQAPDDTATGTVSVVVTTAGGTASGTVTLAPFAPSFLLLDDKHVAGIILRSNGAGAYGGGAYDILGPTGASLGYQTVAAKAGDIVELYAVFEANQSLRRVGTVVHGRGAHHEPGQRLHQQRERDALI
jgi:uncharacterized protein (TIGR03437 family)